MIQLSSILQIEAGDLDCCLLGCMPSQYLDHMYTEHMSLKKECSSYALCQCLLLIGLQLLWLISTCIYCCFGTARVVLHRFRTDWDDNVMCCAVNVPLPLTDTVQLPVNGPCKSRYLAINVICTTVLSLNMQLYNCIAVFPRLHPNTTYMPNTDDTDYTDIRVVFIIWTDNVNAICTTTISSDIQLWYCIAVFPRLYPSNTYLPNTDYTDYTDNRVVFIIWTDNLNAICTTNISSNIQLWYCIAVFPRLYPPNTYLPNTDYTDYTAYRVVFSHMDRYRSITR